MVFFTGTPAVFAASAERVPWLVEGIGTFYVPGEWQAAKLDLKKTVVDGKNTEDILKTAALDTPNGQMNPADKLNSLDMQAYQVTFNDGSAYHLAWMLFFKDTKQMTDDEREMFAREITEEKKQEVRRLMADLNNNIAKSFVDPKSKLGFQLIELGAVEFPEVNRDQAFAGGARCLITSDNLVFPMCGKAYIFNAGGYMAVTMLVALDAERSFWEPVMRSVMFSLNRR